MSRAAWDGSPSCSPTRPARRAPRFEPECPIASVIVDAGVARVASTLEDGTVVEARVVLSSADPHRTFVDLIAPEQLPGGAAAGDPDPRLPQPRREDQPRPGPPARFRGPLGKQPPGRSTSAPSTSALRVSTTWTVPSRPPAAARFPSGRWSSSPFPRRSIAPSRRRASTWRSMFVQHVPYRLAGSSWEVERDRLADRVFDLVDEVAPGFSESVLHREVLSPAGPGARSSRSAAATSSTAP